MPTKAERQWPAGEDRRIALATSGSTRFRRMPTLCCLRCGDLRSPGITERHNGSLRHRATTTTMMNDVRLMSKWRVKLIFQGTYRLSGTGIVECFKIIEVWCNLKQFDVEAEKRKRKSPELSYGSVENITFSAQCK